MVPREPVHPSVEERPSVSSIPVVTVPDAAAVSARDTARHGLAVSPFESSDPPRIAVYGEPHSPPVVIPIADYPLTEEHFTDLIDTLAVRAHALAQDQGGSIPLPVFRELMGNLVHASFTGVVVTILDRGNTVRVSDRGPGIPDKEAAVRPGFTSADARVKRYIRGVGSGFSVVRQMLGPLGGLLEIDDNLGRGTVVTARVEATPGAPLAPAPLPSYNLSERQLKTLLLVVELAPVGPTRVAHELGVSPSTAYRDLAFLEEAGLVASGPDGHRSATDAGLAYLDGVL